MGHVRQVDRGRSPSPEPDLQVPRKRNSPRRQVKRFALTGAVGFAVDASILAVGIALGLPAWLARIPAVLAAVATTWRINREKTFRTSVPPSLREFTTYLAAMSLGLGINGGLFLVMLWAGADPAVALVVASSAATVANFLTSRRLLDR